ncbi:calsyntenin-1-like isoform X2 [Patiria miniata]|uniref:Cadherin domain-containing protein n=1 Tax=Patiria miniata TaxID=46514 RepID=A0A914BI47_PATMI|nr:calsyntenin-1-like isoform X2 [Patiria miniata]
MVNISRRKQRVRGAEDNTEMFRRSRWAGGALLVALFALSGVNCLEDTPNTKPYFPEKIYHGEVNKTTGVVTIHPQLVARDDDAGPDGEIAGYRLYPDVDVPFAVTLGEHGEAVLRATDTQELGCEKSQAGWQFSIQALDGGMPQKTSHRTEVHIVVNDSNDSPPRFVQSSYTATVSEGVIEDNVLTVEAKDSDCSAAFSTICQYEITTRDGATVPFAIGFDGRISTTKALDGDTESRYLFNVVAYDCGGRSSEPVPVTITVSTLCSPGWKGVARRIEYTPASGMQPLAPMMHLETCTQPNCTTSEVITTVKLQTRHIGFGCDRETYSSESQRKLCGSPSGSFDLLPSPGMGQKWTEDLLTDEGHDSEQIYEFDGEESAVIIPEKYAPTNLTNRFSVSFWMKHGETEGLNKEHIMCSSDSEGLNRHHYAIFIHNCRLVLLLRHQDEGKSDAFFPTEFRWKLDEVCDKQWHRYTFNIDFPSVMLYIDGELHQTKMISDDWPLHHSNYPVALTIGACYDGGKGRFSGHFQGYLAGLSVLPGHVETESTIECMYSCKEGLSIAADDLAADRIQFNAMKTELVIKGDLNDASQLLRRVSYFNSRKFPTPGQRALTIKTITICDGIPMPMTDVSAYVMVVQPAEPTITIEGPSQMAQEGHEIEAGIRPFASISIVSTMSEDQEEEEEAALEEIGKKPDVPLTVSHRLDSCNITTGTYLTSDESFTVPAELLASYHLLKFDSSEGMSIKGVDTIEHYVEVLRQVVYSSSDTTEKLSHTLTVTCTELNGRFQSNEYKITVNVLRKSIKQAIRPNHDKAAPHANILFKPGKNTLEEEMKEKMPLTKLGQITASSTAMTIVIVICVGFLVFMIVLGVFRIYAAHRDSAYDQQDFDWDDSALNITVNPMEGPTETHIGMESDSSDDDDDSCQDDLDDSSEDDDEDDDEEEDGSGEIDVEIKGTQLEWDDSTLKF